MKYIHITIVLLSICSMHVHCMNNNNNNKNNSKQPLLSSHILINDDVEGAAPINNQRRSPYPVATDIFSEENGDTWAQFWTTHSVPTNVQQWTKDAQIDWVRQQKWNKRWEQCNKCCCSKNAKYIYGFACMGGCIFGIGSALAFIDFGGDYDYDVNPSPTQPPSTQSMSQLANYTQSLSKAIVRKSLGNNTDDDHMD